MTLDQTLSDEIKKAAVFMKYANDSLVKKIINKETSFEREVTNFYGISRSSYFSTRPVGVVTTDTLNKNRMNIQGSISRDLVEILNNFSEENLFDYDLSYEHVREEVKLRRKKFIKSKSLSLLVGFPAQIFNLGGLFAGIFIDPSSYLFMLPGIYLTYKFFKIPYPEDTAFDKLCPAAEEADNYIRYYRHYAFLKQNEKK